MHCEQQYKQVWQQQQMLQKVAQHLPPAASTVLLHGPLRMQGQQQRLLLMLPGQQQLQQLVLLGQQQLQLLTWQGQLRQ
jgi:hypothetical protein